MARRRMPIRMAVWVALICGIGPLLSAAPPEPMPADLILHHGKVVTVDAEFRLATALAVRGKRLIGVGSDDEILKLRGAETTVVDLHGQTVLPGLIDSHTHPGSAAMHEFDHPIPNMETIADLLAYIAGRADAVDDGAWISVRQVFITRLREQRYPTRTELDAAAPKNPVVFSTGPDAILNSLALEASGIGKDYKITDGGTGIVELDPATGEPTGLLRSCGRLIKSKGSGKSATPEERLARLRDLLAHYNAVGLTSIADRAASDDAIDLYSKLKAAGELNCRVFLSYGIDPNAPIEKVEAQLQKAAEHPLHEYDDLLWLRGIKMFLDGGMLTGSAYMREPWGESDIYSIRDPNYRGLKYIEQERLTAVVGAALRLDLQPTAHAQGDAAVLSLIEAYATVNKESPVREKRPCITHSSFMSAEAIQQMHELGVVADLQPAWLYLDGATLLRQFGPERTRYFHPYKSLAERGVIVGGGSDHMQKMGDMQSVNPYNPFWAIWITLTRTPRWMDGPLHPEENLSREQAIRLYTINNAYLTFEEKEKGSLETGKLADFIVLKTDILTCPVDEVKDIQVERTYLGGKLVYQRPAEGATP